MMTRCRLSPFGRRVGGLAAIALVVGLLASPVAAEDYKYDALGRLIQVTYASGAIVQYSYDAAGNRTTVVSGLPNHAPVAANDTAAVAASAYVDIMVRANDSDPDGDPLTVTAVSTPSGGGSVSIRSSGAHVRYTAPAMGGTKTFTYTVSDGQGGTDTATVTVTVSAPNQPPVAVDDYYSVETYTTEYLYVRGNDSDPDGDPLTITSVSGAGASIGSGGSYIIYAGGSLGIKTVTYTISDGRGGTDTGTVTIEMYRDFGGKSSSVDSSAEGAETPHVDGVADEQ
jgi:YD repeat-containing protein